MSNVSPKVRALVIERDEGRCVRCGVQLCDDDGRPFRQYSLQHRRATGMGGSRAPDTNAPQNLILVCGHATGGGVNGGTGCHWRMEQRSSAGWEHGWWIKQAEDPLEIPVTTWRGPVFLDADGGWRHAEGLGRGEVTNPFTGETERTPF